MSMRKHHLKSQSFCYWITNIYRGNKKYHRLFKTFRSKMWNFTGRGILIPNVSGIEHLFENMECATEYQKDILDMNYEELLLEQNAEHFKIWDEWKRHYLLQGLDNALNRFPKLMNLHTLSEKDFNEWLKVFNSEKNYRNYKLDVQENYNVMKIHSSPQPQSNVNVLPLSLENNSTVTGTGAIIQEFGNMSRMPNKDLTRYIPYDQSTKSYSLKQARNHFEYLRMLYDHQSDMADYEEQFNIMEKWLDTGSYKPPEANKHVQKPAVAEEGSYQDDSFLSDIEPLDDDFIQDVESLLEEDSVTFPDAHGPEAGAEAVPSSTLASKNKLFHKEDSLFASTYGKLQSKLWKLHDQGKIDDYIKYLEDKLSIFPECRDHLGRTLLHCAVEKDNSLFSQCLMTAGFNPNVTEHCGATPLTIAVCQIRPKLCELLVNCGADVRGPLYVGIPTPLEMALKLQYAEIYEILNLYESDIEDNDIKSYDKLIKNNSQQEEC